MDARVLRGAHRFADASFEWQHERSTLLTTDSFFIQCQGLALEVGPAFVRGSVQKAPGHYCKRA